MDKKAWTRVRVVRLQHGIKLWLTAVTTAKFQYDVLQRGDTHFRKMRFQVLWDCLQEMERFQEALLTGSKRCEDARYRRAHFHERAYCSHISDMLQGLQQPIQ